MTTPVSRRFTIILTIILVVLACAGFLRLNDLSLYSDSTRYVIWANALAGGHGWVDATQPEPEYYVVNAPFTPVFLVPSQWIAPLSLIAAKVLTLGYGIVAIALFALFARRLLTERTALIITALFAVIPLTLVMFTEGLSEAPFFLLTFIALACVERSAADEWTMRDRVVLAITIALLPLLREVAITLVAAIAVFFAVRRRWVDAMLVMGAGLAGVALWSWRNLVLVGVPATSQSANIQFIFDHVVTPADTPIVMEWLARMGANLHAYTYELTGMIIYPFPLNLIQDPTGFFSGLVSILNSVKPFVGILFIPLVIFGIWSDVKRSSTGLLRLSFVVFYLTVILLYPLQDIRFFLPLIPFVLLFLAQAVRTLPAARSTRERIGLACAVLVFLPNASAAIELVRTNLRYRTTVNDAMLNASAFHLRGYYGTPWALAGTVIEELVPEHAVIASAAKEIVPFAGARKVLELNRAVPQPMFEAMLRANDVSIVVAQQVRSGVGSYEFQLAESHRFRFEKMAGIGWLTMYRVRRCLAEGCAPGLAEPDTAMTPVQAALHGGRHALLRKDLMQADSLLALARAMDPANAEVAYQRVVLAAFGGTLEQAVTAQQELFSTPRSTSYSPPGRALLSIAQLRVQAEKRSGPDRARDLYLAGRTALDLGYPVFARAFFDSAVSADPNDFEALLWSMHQAFQSGDTASARSRLKQLQNIDAANAVVKGFTEIDRAHDRLRSSRSARERADLHLAISQVYERIGLPEIAMDSAERAWQTDPSSARHRIAEILKNTGQSFGASRYAVP